MRAQLWPDEDARALAKELPGMLKQPRWRCWVAELDGQLLGFAEAYLRDFANGCEGQPVVFLEGIWVARGWRRKGVGKKLVAAVEGWARAKGLREIGSDILVGNRLSMRAHEGWGFKETERVVYFRKTLKR